MDRRTFIETAGVIVTGFLAGCAGAGDGDATPTSTPTEDPTPTASATPVETDEDLPQHYAGGPGAHLLMVEWVREAPDDIEPYPSDEPPVSDYDVVREIFDEAVGRGDSTPASEPSRENRVAWEFSEARFYEIRADFEGIEGNGDRPKYFEHRGAVVALTFDVLD